MTEREEIERAVMINVTAPPNTGKTLIGKCLGEYYSERGLTVARVKYPVYKPEDFGAIDYEKTGERINAYIREGNPENWDVRTAQQFYAKNRIYFDEMIGIWRREKDVIISEDGKYSSIIWGPIMDQNLKREEIEVWNRGIIEPHICFTLRGPRLNGIEPNHKFETSGDDKWLRCKKMHLSMAEELEWAIIDYEKKEGEEEINKEAGRVSMEIITASEFLFERRKII